MDGPTDEKTLAAGVVGDGAGAEDETPRGTSE